MLRYVVVFLVATVLCPTPSLAKTYTRCSLAQGMFELKVPKAELARWTCIAQHESRYNTKAVGTMNRNRSRDYGIFQINNKYWCTPPDGGSSYNECKIGCADFLVDSIEPSVKCARQILRQQGWKAWSTWKFCNGTLPSIDDCF